MGGYKTWVDLEILNADDLNSYLMAQTIPRFADATARDAAITSPSDGQQAFLESDNITYTHITVSGTGYWAPEKGTLLCSVNQTTAQTAMAHGTSYAVTMTSIVKNLNTWWASNKFTPQVPGYYEITGGVGWSAVGGGAAGYRNAWLRLNGSTVVIGSAQQGVAVTNYSTMVGVRPSPVYFNGTGDYLELMAVHSNGTGTTVDTVVGGAASSNLHAKYLGL